LSAVLGGTQSLHTNAMDEALALPTENAARIALRTQQVLAFETGVTNTIDPLGGSYFVEWLTNRLEQEAEQYFARIEEQGGVLACIENGFFQREIADAAFRYEREVSSKQRLVVGVNAFQSGESENVPILKIDVETERGQRGRVGAVRQRRDAAAVPASLEALKRAAGGTANLMPPLLDCVRAYATEGEIMRALKEVFGVYREPNVF
jgi:methylmalonyl-CoA mutase N-terminal domain/subunit